MTTAALATATSGTTTMMAGNTMTTAALTTATAMGAVVATAISLTAALSLRLYSLRWRGGMGAQWRLQRGEQRNSRNAGGCKLRLLRAWAMGRVTEALGLECNVLRRT